MGLYYDEMIFSMRGLQVGGPFQVIHDLACEAARDTSCMIKDASDGNFNYGLATDIGYFECADVLTGSKEFMQALPWLAMGNRKPIVFHTAVASTFHEAVVLLTLEVIRIALLAGNPAFEEILDFESDLFLPDKAPDSFEVKAATNALRKYEAFDVHAVFIRLELEASAAWARWLSHGAKLPTQESARPPLTDAQKQVLDFVKAYPGKIAKEIEGALGIPASTFTRHLVPALRPWGLRNRRGHGYYIESGA